MPNDWSLVGPVDLDEQADYYKTMFASISEKPWFYGYMLWDWPAQLYSLEEAASNDDYCIYGKKAEHVVAEHYRGLK
jgi:hypothetical protein